MHRDAARLCDFDADAGHLDIASSAAFAGAYRTVSPRSSGVDRLPASRELGFESSDILEKALSDQLEKVKTELWILEEKLLDLAIADLQQGSFLDAFERLRAGALSAPGAAADGPGIGRSVQRLSAEVSAPTARSRASEL